MFKESDNGQTQYCPMCQEWAEKYEKLEQENEELKGRNANLRLNLATYDLPEIRKVLTDWRTGELDKKFKKLQKENKRLSLRIEELEKENEELKQ